ncbi:hypothetical protein LEP1GSC071_0692 [Leptospira santarosai str. JET]|nr:hypothetical protein LEP1GSC071_0692 [Leptospira santarosai str. JET]EPG83307.1 hypothetical protein LEP1GSC048_2769 [Leptospira santarosai serovar Shermani str. 1342KT]
MRERTNSRFLNFYQCITQDREKVFYSKPFSNIIIHFGSALRTGLSRPSPNFVILLMSS